MLVHNEAVHAGDPSSAEEFDARGVRADLMDAEAASAGAPRSQSRC